MEKSFPFRWANRLKGISEIRIILFRETIRSSPRPTLKDFGGNAMTKILFFTAVAIAMLIVLGNSFQEVKKKADSSELPAKLVSEGIKK
jgi:hypothetical protein